MLTPVLTLPVFPVGNVESHEKGWTSHKDQLESPEPGVGDGEKVVVADIVATRLAGVAVKVLLFVTPDLLAGHQEDQEPKDENDGKPDSTKSCGVLVGPTEEALQEDPVHGVASDVGLDLLEATEYQKKIPKVGQVLNTAHCELGMPGTKTL